MFQRTHRYQGAIVRGHELLMLIHREVKGGREYWVLPGGGMEPGESEEACVTREMKEETGLDVTIERRLLEVDGLHGSVYKTYVTYLCSADGGEAAPGYEPEPEAQANYSIVGVRWIDLRDPLGWDPALVSDPYSYPQLLKIRAALGY